jgi:hypothetical protein
MKGSIAQLVEHRTFNPQVPGSSPGGPTISKKENMDTYTIMQYNTKTKQYTTIGYADASNSEQAKLKYVEQSGWKPERNVLLFAKPPLCR